MKKMTETQTGYAREDGGGSGLYPAAEPITMAIELSRLQFSPRKSFLLVMNILIFSLPSSRIECFKPPLRGLKFTLACLLEYKFTLIFPYILVFLSYGVQGGLTTPLW